MVIMSTIGCESDTLSSLSAMALQQFQKEEKKNKQTTKALQRVAITRIHSTVPASIRDVLVPPHVALCITATPP